MKKAISGLLAAVVLLGGCARLSSWINPLSDEGEQTSDVFEPNRFLWQAALDKLAFMKIAEQNKEAGTIVTEWSPVEGVKNEEFKIEAKVLSTELRSDCLQAVVYERRWNGTGWQELEPNRVLNQEMETAILNQARILYRNSLAINQN